MVNAVKMDNMFNLRHAFNIWHTHTHTHTLLNKYTAEALKTNDQLENKISAELTK